MQLPEHGLVLILFRGAAWMILASIGLDLYVIESRQVLAHIRSVHRYDLDFMITRYALHTCRDSCLWLYIALY